MRNMPRVFVVVSLVLFTTPALAQVQVREGDLVRIVTLGASVTREGELQAIDRAGFTVRTGSAGEGWQSVTIPEDSIETFSVWIDQGRARKTGVLIGGLLGAVAGVGFQAANALSHDPACQFGACQESTSAGEIGLGGAVGLGIGMSVGWLIGSTQGSRWQVVPLEFGVTMVRPPADGAGPVP